MHTGLPSGTRLLTLSKKCTNFADTLYKVYYEVYEVFKVIILP